MGSRGQEKLWEEEISKFGDFFPSSLIGMLSYVWKADVSSWLVHRCCSCICSLWPLLLFFVEWDLTLHSLFLKIRNVWCSFGQTPTSGVIGISISSPTSRLKTAPSREHKEDRVPVASGCYREPQCTRSTSGVFLLVSLKLLSRTICLEPSPWNCFLLPSLLLA